jgi:hypothetical protein
MARRGRKRNVEVTRVDYQPRETNISPQEAVRLWKTLKEKIRNPENGGHVTNHLGSHFGRLVLLGVYNSEQYEAGLEWHQILMDHRRIVMDGDCNKLQAKISRGEQRSQSHGETPYSTAQVNAIQDMYDMVLATVVEVPRGAQAWDGLLELIVMDRFIDWNLQRLVGDALTRLHAVIGRGTK